MFKTPKYKLITIQSFLTNFCYVFLHLTGYSPTKGLNTDNHGKFPFLSAVGGLFEPANSLLKYNSGFPFERFDLEEDRIFFVSEPNIISVFCNNIFGNNQILLENIQPITETDCSFSVNSAPSFGAFLLYNTIEVVCVKSL